MHERRVNSVGEKHTKKSELAHLKISDIYGVCERTQTEDAALVILAASIAKHGLLQPVIVRENRDIGRYKLISGARRLRACSMMGFTHVDAVVLTCSEPEAAACFMEEHLTRIVPSVIAEARMLDRTGLDKVHTCFALPASELDDRIQLLKLTEGVQNEIEKGRLTLEQAKPLLRIRDAGCQLEAASIIGQRKLSGAQAVRLVSGRREDTERGGKRRMTAVVLDTVNRAVESLRARGIPIQVHMYTQDSSLRIQISIKTKPIES